MVCQIFFGYFALPNLWIIYARHPFFFVSLVNLKTDIYFRLLKTKGGARHPINMTMINTIVKTTDLEDFAVCLLQ